MFQSVETSFKLSNHKNPSSQSLQPHEPNFSTCVPLHWRSRSIPLNSRKDFTPLLPIPKLQKPNSLPRARRQTTIGDGYADAGADEGGFDVCLFLVSNQFFRAMNWSFCTTRNKNTLKELDTTPSVNQRRGQKQER